MQRTLEDLPDEILLLICRNLSQYDVIRAFFNLNHRLNWTISDYVRTLVIMDNWSRSRSLLRILGPYLHSLTIKDTRLDPEEIRLASNIEELTFIHASSDSIPPLDNLTDLNIINGPSFRSIDVLFANNNKLHSVYISSTSPLSIPRWSTPRFSTIKQLAITLQQLDDFLNILRLCPELTCLNLNLRSHTFLEKENHDHQISSSTSSTLRVFSLRTFYEHNIDFDTLKSILNYLPSELELLAIEIYTEDATCLDGQLWQEYIKEKLPALNRFEFFILLRQENGVQPYQLRLHNVFKTFDSIFWSSIIPQKITGYYNRIHAGESICIHTKVIPTVNRRRYFVY